jgi:hypothetical protein
MTISELLAAIKTLEQQYGALETRLNNLAMLFCKSPTSSMCSALYRTKAECIMDIDPESLNRQFGLTFAIEEAVAKLEPIVTDLKILPDTPEKEMLQKRAENLLASLRNQVVRAETLLDLMVQNGIPSPLWELSTALFRTIQQNMQQGFCSNVTQEVRVASKRDNKVCYGSYLLCENALRGDNQIFPCVSIIVGQEIDVQTGLADKPFVALALNADNAPNRVLGISVNDAETALKILEQMLRDTDLPMLHDLSRALSINEEMLKRKWERVSIRGNRIELYFNMLLWPQYFVQDDKKWKPTEKLESDILLDMKKATALDDAKIRYRMEMRSPFCIVIVTLGD